VIALSSDTNVFEIEVDLEELGIDE
jgi:hypothetical protein